MIVNKSIISLLLLTLVLLTNAQLDLGGLLGMMKGMKMELHGNYCGMNHGDATYKQAPIDAIDAACKKHDMCYHKYYGDCYCDYEFLTELDNAVSKVDENAKSKAALMQSWFRSSPCSCLNKEGSRYQLENSITRKTKAKCKSPVNNKI